MKFDRGIDKRYRQSVEDAFEAIIANGDALHREIAGLILESNMLVRVQPVSKVKASGVTGLIDPGETKDKIEDGNLSLREALGEVYISIAEETIDTGGQRGCEGTFVHEGRHAYDFARMIESYSNAGVNPLSIFDPTLYELEWEAHKISGDYMLCVGRDEYIEEGLGLMILGRNDTIEPCYVNDIGINTRLNDSYGLDSDKKPGPRASELLGLNVNSFF
jgi:hypothetical protein